MKLGSGGTTRWRSLVYHVDVLRLAHCILGSLAWRHGQGLAQHHNGVHDLILVPDDPEM